VACRVQYGVWGRDKTYTLTYGLQNADVVRVIFANRRWTFVHEPRETPSWLCDAHSEWPCVTLWANNVGDA